MKYFLDTEFIEGTQKKFIGKTKPTIDLISIGLVKEDGSEIYAISKEFNLKEAWNRFDKVECCAIPSMCGSKSDGHCEGFKRVYWIRENVLRPIYYELKSRLTNVEKTMFPEFSDGFNYKSMKYLIEKFGQTNMEIANDICYFIFGYDDIFSNPLELAKKYTVTDKALKPEFYGYYSNYDWVVFCWLFGKMIDLPKDFPMYCKDLKQMMDELGLDTEWKRANFPEPIGEHNALVDARWNLQLYKKIMEVKNERK